MAQEIGFSLATIKKAFDQYLIEANNRAISLEYTDLDSTREWPKFKDKLLNEAKELAIKRKK